MPKMKFNEEMAQQYGRHRRQAALTARQIIDAYTLYHLHGMSGLEIAHRFSIGKSTVYRIVNGEEFGDITGGLLNIENDTKC
jgi:transposase